MNLNSKLPPTFLLFLAYIFLLHVLKTPQYSSIITIIVIIIAFNNLLSF